MLASGSCLGKIRSCENSDGGISVKLAGLHCANWWGCRVVPKGTAWDWRITESTHNTFHRKDRNQTTFWRASDGQMIFTVACWRGGMTQQWMYSFGISVIWLISTWCHILPLSSWQSHFSSWALFLQSRGNNFSLPCKVSVLVGFVRCLVTQV